MVVLDLVREYGPEEFREQLQEASTPEAEKVADEIAVMLAAGGGVRRG